MLPVTLLFSFDKPTFNEGLSFLSNFMASEEFVTLKKHCSDIELLDTIYFKAVRFFNGDISESLLALTFATLPYKEMPLLIPWIGISANLPLPSAADSIYRKKNKNTPKIIVHDSPKNSAGDKDKLPHFFGNAFIAYNLSLFNFSHFLSIFIELFENTFKVEGAVDFRDLSINRFGEIFGDSLRRNNTSVPSEIIKLYSITNTIYNF